MDQLGALLPLVLLVGVFYLLILRPARKRQQDQRNTIAALAPGRRVMTSSGIFGTVTAVGDRVELEVADGVRIELLPAAIQQVLPEPVPESADAGETPAVSDTSDQQQNDTPAA